MYKFCVYICTFPLFYFIWKITIFVSFWKNYHDILLFSYYWKLTRNVNWKPLEKKKKEKNEGKKVPKNKDRQVETREKNEKEKSLIVLNSWALSSTRKWNFTTINTRDTWQKINKKEHTQKKQKQNTRDNQRVQIPTRCWKT